MDQRKDLIDKLSKPYDAEIDKIFFGDNANPLKEFTRTALTILQFKSQSGVSENHDPAGYSEAADSSNSLAKIYYAHQERMAIYPMDPNYSKRVNIKSTNAAQRNKELMGAKFESDMSAATASIGKFGDTIVIMGVAHLPTIFNQLKNQKGIHAVGFNFIPDMLDANKVPTYMKSRTEKLNNFYAPKISTNYQISQPNALAMVLCASTESRYNAAEITLEQAQQRIKLINIMITKAASISSAGQPMIRIPTPN